MGPPPPRARWWMWKRFLIAVFLIVGLAAGATATAGLLQVKQIVDQGHIPGSQLRFSGPSPITPAQAGAAQTILILGSDKRLHNFGGNRNVRSDTILLARLNPNGGATTLMSIPRDLEVAIPGHGQDKINAAYAEGGPALSAKVVKALLSTPGRPFRINHIININFSGFQRAVNYLGRVYTDIDRYYFNNNAPPAGGGGGYATIDIKPGYQLLAGGAALDYVRFRHLDQDLIRARRQQGFLRDAASQYGAGKLINDRTQLARIFYAYTQSDHELHTVSGITKLLSLVIFLGAKPIVEVPFPGQLPLDKNDPFVHVVSQSLLTRRVGQFLNGTAKTPAPPKPAKPAKSSKHHRQRQTKVAGVPGMVDASTQGEGQGTALGAGVGLPVYYPKLIPVDARYPSLMANVYPRKYAIQGPLKHPYKSYRLTLEINGGVDGRYVGIEGTTWKDPPILKNPSEIRPMNHRKLELFFDQGRLRLVAWHTPNGAYWVENDLAESVSNRQMLAMAASLTRIGSKR